MTATLGERVDVAPAAVLFTAPGDSRRLTAQRFDAAGNPTAGSPSWTSSHPEVVEVAADGTITAKVFGSSQITAEVGGLKSAPALVVVTQPAAGVRVIPDEQIVGEPVETDPAAEPSLDNTYSVPLSGVDVAVGDRLLGAGEKALAGEVVGVGDKSVTMKLVPLPELLPDLHIEEVISLERAAIDIPPAVLEFYDVTRTGNRFDFVPKPDFFEVLPAAHASPRPLAMVGAGYAVLDPESGNLQYSFNIPPFDECKASIGTIPLQLATAPAFTMELSPTLDIAWTEAEKRFLAKAQATYKVAGSLKVTAGFSAQVACDKELFAFRIPVSGPLSFFVAGLVPVKAQVALGGKLTVVEMELGSEATGTATVEAGLRCSPDCSVGGSLATEVKWEPKMRAPTLGLRVEPSIEAYAKLELAIGHPVFTSFRLDMLGVKAGAKLAGDWAPRLTQMADSAYASKWKLTAEGRIGIGTKLTDIAALLGLSELTGAEYALTREIGLSPQGAVTADKAAYSAGEQVTLTIDLDEASLELLGRYNIKKVIVVRHHDGIETVLGEQEASEGTPNFVFTLPAPEALPASELYAFVVSTVPPIDDFSLELEKGCGAPPISAEWVAYMLGLTFTGMLTSPAAVASEERIYFDPPLGGGEGIAIFFRDSDSPIGLSGADFEGGGWTGRFSIVCDGGSKFAQLDASSATFGMFVGRSRELPDTLGGD
jgi:hypothetical protein